MGFDRSKFKGTSIKTIAKKNEELEQQTSFSTKNRNKFLKLKEGKNKIRIYPAHPGTESFYQPSVVHFLPILNEWTDKDGNQKSEVKRKPVFSAKTHSTMGNLCPIDAYIQSVYRIAGEEFQDKEDREKYTKKIKGRNGITGNTSFIVYAQIGNDFGRLQLKTSVKNALDEIAIGQDDEDGVISTDPFSHPDTGHCAIVTYDSQKTRDEKDKKAEDYYKTAIDLKGATPLTDDQLGDLMECKSLEEIYVDVYTQKDFDFAIEGLERFDKEQKLGVFGDDKFLDELEKIGELVKPAPSEDEDNKAEEKAEEPKATTRKSSRSQREEEKVEEPETEEEPESDLPFDVDIMDMDKEALKGVIRRNSLPIRSIDRIDLQEAREWVKEEMEIVEKEKAAKVSEDAKEAKEETSGRRSRRGGGSRLSQAQEELEA